MTALMLVLTSILVLSGCLIKDVTAFTFAQNPPLPQALRILRGGKDYTTADINRILRSAVPGVDYPVNARIPPNDVLCAGYHQPGFYADTSAPSKCQAYHRCDDNLVRTDFLCPNRTLFNQITLICDWFYNVDCDMSAQFADYSNHRLEQVEEPLFDD